MERRELADLRELIFNQNNEAETEAEEDAQDTVFPYEVQQDTLIFGGHQTWLRTIRQLLKGNIRFIDKDLIFDVSIVRHAEQIWIQPNALSHPQYYRIMDTARTFHKPVRFFAFASAGKCAKQLVDSETELLIMLFFREKTPPLKRFELICHQTISQGESKPWTSIFPFRSFP